MLQHLEHTIPQATATVRLGIFSYLNIQPVYYQFHASPPLHSLGRGSGGEIELVTGTPAQLNDALLSGLIDISNISAYAFGQHHDTLALLPELSIAANGPVESVLLFSWHERWQDLDGRRIALTNHSATAARLVRLLSAERYGIAPKYVTMPPDLDAMLTAADAALLIGDIALVEGTLRRTVAGRSRPYIFDLGAEWRDWTGLPFVFGVWAARADRLKQIDRSGVLAAIRHSKMSGLAHIDEIAASYATRLGLAPEICARYLRRLRYDLNADDQRGLRRYLETVVPDLRWDALRWLP